MKKQIVVPILNDEYKVIVCFGTPKEIERVLRYWGLSENVVFSGFADRRGVTFFRDGCHPVIALPRLPKISTEHGTLAHEAVHAVGHIFSRISQNSAEEVFAHSVGAIVRKVLENGK